MCCLVSFQSATAPAQIVLSQNLLGETFTCAHDALNLAYKKLGIEVQFLTLPNRRGLRMSNSGEIDGELLRVEGAELDYPNLIRVPVPLCLIASVLIGNERVVAKEYEDLRKYRFGITSGYIYQENLISKYQLNATKVLKNHILLEMLVRDRVDVIFLPIQEAQEMILKSRNVKLKIIEGFNRKTLLYHYLHKKHINLLPSVTQALQELRKEDKIELENRKLRNVPTS